VKVSDEFWQDQIRIKGWPECGDGHTTPEELYQAFKERLMRELHAGRKLRTDERGPFYEGYPLTDKSGDIDWENAK
jgi:hypothetical protein